MKKIIKILIIGLLLIPLNVFAKEEVTLSKCVDGDTAKLVVKNKVRTVRFLAVDTPESVHPKKKVEPYGKEASSYTCKKLENAKTIEIEYDNNSTKTDKYDRILAWIFVDDELLQKDLVRNGYAKVAYLYGDYKYTDILKDEENIAKNKKLRIWSANTTSSEEDDDIVEKSIESFIKIIKKLLKSL